MTEPLAGPITSRREGAARSSLDSRVGRSGRMLMQAEHPGIDTALGSWFPALTGRERQVLSLIAAGLSYQGIARELVISINTVQAHVKNIYQKLDVHSGNAAVAAARRMRLIA